MGAGGSHSPNQSAASASTVPTRDETTRSGSPMVQPAASQTSGGGRSAGFPRGAPASTQAAMVSISASLSEGSSLKCWMPMFLSMNHGGISRAAVRLRIDRAQGRTSA